MSETMKLQVQTGLVTVELEDEQGRSLGRFDFNPSDSNIARRYGDVAAFFEALAVEQDLPESEQLAAFDKLGRQIEEQFDYLLDGPVSQEIFGRCGPLTVTKNGQFYFETVLEGVGRLVEQVTKKRLDRKMAKIKKAAGKYAG